MPVIFLQSLIILGKVAPTIIPSALLDIDQFKNSWYNDTVLEFFESFTFMSYDILASGALI
ncbi:uncharacterized protein METZ01_LOCUS147444 [marine metagenome]|uniref:Uncharacterized protein n=1 Tax=marine metagenome TaxID=408172 RepID=A0A381ZZB8_9ZZZZ